jgi:hypothetical protein
MNGVMSYPKHTKYPEGYASKVEYWQMRYYIALGKGVCAYNDGDVELGKECNEEAHLCMGKLSYFTSKQNLWAQRQ